MALKSLREAETFRAIFRLYVCGQKRPLKSRKLKKYKLRQKRRPNMNQTDINKYKAILEAKQADLSAGLRNRDDIAIEKTPDAIDEVQLAGERELAIRNLDRESNLLRNVKGALARIADGSYGVCLHCDEDIKPKRLDAVPWTRYCITCQEAADRHEFEADNGDGADDILANAA
jgi:RNA polymerase-binding transcription factor